MRPDTAMRRKAPFRVVQVSSFAPPHLGGLETSAAGIFRSLRRVGIDMEWVASDVPERAPEAGMVLVPAWDGIERLWGIPLPVPTPRALRPIWRAVRRAELVHLHDVMYLNCFLAAVFARALHKPLVVTLHIWQVPYESWVATTAQSLGLATIGRVCLRLASVVVVYSRTVLEKARTYFTGPVRMIPNGVADEFIVDEAEIAADRRRARRDALQLPADAPIVVFAGRFVEKKGFSRIRRIAERLPLTVVLLCGEGTVDPRAWGLGNVRVLGRKTAIELRDLFLASDLLLLPSVGEGFPLVVQEAMACGLPAAILRETWQAWGEGAEHFVLGGSADFDDVVERYLQNPFGEDRRRRLIHYARQSWSWEQAALAYEAVYESSCNVAAR